MKIAIIGTGAWATALAQVLSDNGHSPLMYGIEASQVEDINHFHRNGAYFGPLVIHPSIKATSDLSLALKEAKVVILCVPSGAMSKVCLTLNEALDHRVTLVNATKGFTDKNERMSTIIKSSINREKRYPLVSLIGPSHAEEVIQRHLTAITATSKSKRRAAIVATIFSNPYFRVYIQKDEVGAEIGVAMKNAIAIASGIIEGLGLGDNARAALVTRGLSEMTIFGRHFGGKLKTYLGLTGLGDLIVTCYSFHSRNFKAGLAIGKADDATNFLATNKTTVEGIRAAKTIYELALKHHIDTPIVNAVYAVLYEGAQPSIMINKLMQRPLKEE
ncbi:MAG TPA: glycerol-3-phosphate dehydrogenase [Firmicutes bacterium]|jgi:glycerol-3-phosphate dehydrogenase (NAD(P)+)|nr:glycerol-3-phosphate dehydrogenase [Bacillota bacterium]